MKRKTFKNNISAVYEAAKGGEVAALNRCGAYIRGAARRSIRTTKQAHAPPGSPPNQRGGKTPFKNSIVYELNNEKTTVYIGSAPNSSRVPKTLEHGGAARFSLLEIYRDKKHKATGTAFRAFKESVKGVNRAEMKRKRQTIQEPRPFMEPALSGFIKVALNQFKNIL